MKKLIVFIWGCIGITVPFSFVSAGSVEVIESYIKGLSHPSESKRSTAAWRLSQDYLDGRVGDDYNLDEIYLLEENLDLLIKILDRDEKGRSFIIQLFGSRNLGGYPSPIPCYMSDRNRTLVEESLQRFISSKVPENGDNRSKVDKYWINESEKALQKIGICQEKS